MTLTEGQLRKAAKWFFGRAKDLFSKKRETEKEKKKSGNITDLKDISSKMYNFNLYMTLYPDPLYKDTLPVYDQLPLFFPISMTGAAHGSGPKIQGLNIHYLSPANRKVFMQEILFVIKKNAVRAGYDPDTLDDIPPTVINGWVGKYINAVYSQQQKSAGSKIKVAYRSYLLNRIKGKMIKIKFSEWDNAVNVVLPRFKKMSPSATYQYVNEQYAKYKNNPWGPLR